MGSGWYCRYGVSYRALAEMMTSAGRAGRSHHDLSLVQKYAPELDKQTRWYRQVKYLNNILEGDHGRLKRILGPKGAFKNRTSAYRTLKGIEAMHSLRKGQDAMFANKQPNPDAVIVNQVFETV